MAFSKLEAWTKDEVSVTSFNGVGSSVVESWIVIPVVAGSIPVLHPKFCRKDIG